MKQGKQKILQEQQLQQNQQQKHGVKKLEAALAGQLQRLYSGQGVVVVEDGGRVCYYCSVCGKWAYTDSSLADHLQGKGHRKMMEAHPPCVPSLGIPWKLPIQAGRLALLPRAPSGPASGAADVLLTTNPQHTPPSHGTRKRGASGSNLQNCPGATNEPLAINAKSTPPTPRTTKSVITQEGRLKRGRSSRSPVATLRSGGVRSHSSSSARCIGLPPWKLVGPLTLKAGPGSSEQGQRPSGASTAGAAAAPCQRSQGARIFKRDAAAPPKKRRCLDVGVGNKAAGVGDESQRKYNSKADLTMKKEGRVQEKVRTEAERVCHDTEEHVEVVLLDQPSIPCFPALNASHPSICTSAAPSHPPLAPNTLHSHAHADHRNCQAVEENTTASASCPGDVDHQKCRVIDTCCMESAPGHGEDHGRGNALEEKALRSVPCQGKEQQEECHALQRSVQSHLGEECHEDCHALEKRPMEGAPCPGEDGPGKHLSAAAGGSMNPAKAGTCPQLALMLMDFSVDLGRGKCCCACGPGSSECLPDCLMSEEATLAQLRRLGTEPESAKEPRGVGAEPGVQMAPGGQGVTEAAGGMEVAGGGAASAAAFMGDCARTRGQAKAQAKRRRRWGRSQAKGGASTSERHCFLCGQAMAAGDKVATLWDVDIGRPACSSRNDHGKFHIFHACCLWDWAIFSKASVAMRQRHPARAGRGLLPCADSVPESVPSEDPAPGLLPSSSSGASDGSTECKEAAIPLCGPAGAQTGKETPALGVDVPPPPLLDVPSLLSPSGASASSDEGSPAGNPSRAGGHTRGIEHECCRAEMQAVPGGGDVGLRGAGPAASDEGVQVHTALVNGWTATAGQLEQGAENSGMPCVQQQEEHGSGDPEGALRRGAEPVQCWGDMGELFCPECQGTGVRGAHGELEHPRYRLLQVYDWILTMLLARSTPPMASSSTKVPGANGVPSTELHLTGLRFNVSDNQMQEALVHASQNVRVINSGGALHSCHSA